MELKFFKYLFLILLCSFYGCSASTGSIDKKILSLENSSFDVVEKDLIFSGDIPVHLKNSIEVWFNKRIKVNGFEGKLTIIIDNYIENISNIIDGKRVDLSMNFNAEISKLDNKKIIKTKGKVKSYGTLVGDFTLNEFDILISNSQNELIVILSEKLNSSF